MSRLNTAKLIVAKPKAKTDSIFYLIGVVWDNCSNLIDVCSCQRSLTEKPEIDMLHQDRKWNCQAHGEETIAAYVQSKDDIKQTKTTEHIPKYS